MFCLLKDGKEVNAVMLVGRLFHARATVKDLMSWYYLNASTASIRQVLKYLSKFNRTQQN